MKTMQIGKGILIGCMVVGAAVASFARDVAWTGAAGNGSWKDSGNWDDAAPDGADDIVIFDKDAEVTLDTGKATDVSYLFVREGEATIKAADGSVLVPNKAMDTGLSGLAVSNGATLFLEAPLTSAIPFAKNHLGSLVIRSKVTQTSSLGSGGSFTLNVGSNVVEQTGEISVPSAGIIIGGSIPNGSPTMSPSILYVRDNGKVTVKRLYVKGGSNPQPCDIVQEGENTSVYASYDLQLGWCDFRASTVQTNVSYTLRSGSFETRFFDVAKSAESYFRQYGGTVNVTDRLKIGENAPGHVELHGGSMSIAKSSGGAGLVFDGVGGTFDFSGGTLSLAYDTRFPAEINVSGNPGFAAPAGKTTIVGDEIDLRAVTNVTVSGAGYVGFEGVRIASAPLTVAGGNARLEENSRFVAPAKSSAPWKLTVRDGGTFRLMRQNSLVFAPVDLSLENGGRIIFSNKEGPSANYVYSTLVAHRYAIDGVAQAKGRHLSAKGATDPVYGPTGASIVVPYVWTGAGDGTTWGQAENWAGNEVPPNDYATAVDLTQAAGKTVTVSGETKLTFIGFMPTGAEKKLTIAGDAGASIAMSVPQHHNAAFLVPEGAEIAMDVDFLRPAADPACHMSFIGGGRLTLKRASQGMTEYTANNYGTMLPPMAFDGTLAIDGPNASLQTWWSGRYNSNLFGFCSLFDCEGRLVFSGDDLNVSADHFLLSGPGARVMASVVQEGGTISLPDISSTQLRIVNNYASDTLSPCYHLKGGLLNSIYLYLGGNWANRSRYAGGSFKMTGGTMFLRKAVCEQNDHYFYLEGGKIQISSLGFVASGTDDFCKESRPNTEPAVQLGGVTFEPFGGGAPTGCAIPARFTGRGGATVFDLRYFGFFFSSTVDGSGDFIVRGKGTLEFRDACSAGTATVESGKLSFAATSTLTGLKRLVVTGGSVEMLGTVTAKPDYVSLASESSLALAEGVDFKVGRLFVDGVERTGTVQFGSGTVTVEQPTDRAVWCGTTGGAWNTAANWKGEAVPTSDDLVSLALADGQTIAVDGAAAAAGLDCTTPGVVTLSGSAALALPAGAPVTVAGGVTLVLDAPLSLAGTIFKYGAGTLVLGKDVSAAAAANIRVVEGAVDVQGGTVAATVSPAWTDGTGRVDATVEQNGGAVTIISPTPLRLTISSRLVPGYSPVVVIKQAVAPFSYSAVMVTSSSTSIS